MAAPYPPEEKMGFSPPPYTPYPQDAQPHPPMYPQQPGFMQTETTVITSPAVAPGTAVIITQQVVPRVHSSTFVHCPYCHAQVTTRVRHEAGAMAHIAALAMCLVGCIPCCLFPYCLDGCQDSIHECPNCGRDLAVIKRF